MYRTHSDTATLKLNKIVLVLGPNNIVYIKLGHLGHHYTRLNHKNCPKRGHPDLKNMFLHRPYMGINYYCDFVILVKKRHNIVFLDFPPRRIILNFDLKICHFGSHFELYRSNHKNNHRNGFLDPKNIILHMSHIGITYMWL